MVKYWSIVFSRKRLTQFSLVSTLSYSCWFLSCKTAWNKQFPSPTVFSLWLANVLNKLPEIKEAEDFSKLALTAIEDEDYPMNFMIQDSIESKANTEFMFGKNEPIQQHYHHWVDKLSK